MAKFNDKISNLINSQLPDFVVDDHPQFAQFLKTYFQFMESAELQVTSIESTDGIVLENETGRTDNLILDGSKITSERTQLDQGEKIIFEDTSFGKFTVGETITGFTSGATAKVLAEDLVNGRIYISAQDKFSKDERITGNDSGARAVINSYRPNPVNTIQQLANFRDPDKVISNFLTKFRDEFLKTIPENLALGLDKRNLIKNIKSMYRLKGTQKGHELFFRILFNQVSETFYPREQMLRVSDGQFDTQKVLRSFSTIGDASDLVGRKIIGETSAATAIVESVKKFVVLNKQVSEIVVNEDTINGSFIIGETISGTASDTDDFFIKATITGIPGKKNITNDGSLYAKSDFLSITGGGNGATISIDDIGSGPLSEIVVDNGGSGYSVGDRLVFDNTGTEGVNAEGFVSVVNGAIAGDEGTDAEHIVLEDGTQRGDNYFGNKIVLEPETNSNQNNITDVFLINKGSGYVSLPKITITSSGANAKLLAHGTEIGRVIGLKTNELGEGYERSPTPPTINFRNCILATNISGNFNDNDTITGSISGATGTLASFNADTNVIKVKDLNKNFQLNETITSSSSGTAKVTKLDVAIASLDVVAISDTDGKFLNEDGFISELTMKVQDSLYYQDFSYVIKVGRSITDWRDSFKKTMHTAGFYFTGQVDIASQVSNRIRSITGINSNIDYDGIALIINTLFSTIFGRRLGTTTDGTSLRGSPQAGVDPDFDDSTSEHFTTNTRDVTLNQAITLKFQSTKTLTIRDNTTRFGLAYAGPRMRSINKYWYVYSGSDNPQTGAAGGDSVVRSYIQPMKLSDWNQHRVIGTNLDSVDGTIVQFGEINTPQLKTYLAFPTEISISYS